MKQPLMINKILAKKGFLLVLEFNNGERRFLDFEQYLKKHQKEVNKKLLNLKEFNKVKIKNGSLFWNNTKRIITYNNKKIVDYYNPDPYTIYNESKPLTLDNSLEFFSILKKYDDKLKKNFKHKKPDLISFNKILSALF